MKKIIMSLFVLGIFASCGDAPSTENTENTTNTTMETENTNNGEVPIEEYEITKTPPIMDELANEINGKLESYRTEEKEDLIGAKITLYYDGESLQKVNRSKGDALPKMVDDYYLKDGIVRYIVKNNMRGDGKDVIDHYFFDENGDMTRWVSPDGSERTPADDGFNDQAQRLLSGFQRLVEE